MLLVTVLFVVLKFVEKVGLTAEALNFFYHYHYYYHNHYHHYYYNYNITTSNNSENV